MGGGDNAIAIETNDPNSGNHLRKTGRLHAWRRERCYLALLCSPNSSLDPMSVVPAWILTTSPTHPISLAWDTVRRAADRRKSLPPP